VLRVTGDDVKEAISLSVALKRPDRSFGAIIASKASSLTEGSARVYISVVCMCAWPSQRETFRRSLVACSTVKDLAYVRRRYISVDALRRAIAIVTDGTLQARHPAIWGSATTACASDSKHFGAWDQNLTTQWHVRYGGRGVMIYRHVERHSLCIHSQLKSPPSSDVAAMIAGVIHHCTEMEVEVRHGAAPGEQHKVGGQAALVRNCGYHRRNTSSNS
jgi:Tn3 transposase DDE domain-containing protein